MTKKSEEPKVDRRKFIAGVAAAGAAGTVAKPQLAKAATAPPTATRPSLEVQAAEGKGTPIVWGNGTGKPGSDYMVDVIKTLNIDYIVTNPASSCRGIHESLINYGGNTKPEMLTVMHEETGAAMGHGYFKATGKPLIGLYHGTVGLQHAAMALYNAWCDRAAIITLIGNHLDAAVRPPGVPTAHAAIDPIGVIRDFTKWDDQPWSLQHFGESMVRAYKIAMTPPTEPVALSLDHHLQEAPIPEGMQLTIPQYTPTAPPQGEDNAVREAARLLANAENPVIVAERCARSQEGMDLLAELAATLNAPVVDLRGRLNIANTHYCRSFGLGPMAQADVILGLETTNLWGSVNRFRDNEHPSIVPRVQPGAKLINISVSDLYIRANFQDFQRLQDVDISIGADAQATLPALIEAVRQEITAARRAAIEQRGEARRRAYSAARQGAREDAMYGWEASPISTARLAAEIWQQIRGEDWAVMGDNLGWTDELWTFDRHHQYIGGSTGTGAGWGLPAAVGAALGHREFGRLAINIQNDGDFMYANGAIWTAVYHKIPMLVIMNNNKAYHQETMHVQRVANWRSRGIDRAYIGTEITNPDIRYAEIARAMGAEGIDQITDPNDLAPAIRRGIEIVKAGGVALIDTHMQGR